MCPPKCSHALIRDPEKRREGGYGQREQEEVQGCGSSQEQSFGCSYGQEGNGGGGQCEGRVREGASGGH